MPYFTTADIKEREETHTRFFAKEIFWTYLGDSSTAIGYNWDFLLKLYALDESSQLRGFHRPTGRRDAALRRGITGLVKDSPGAKEKEEEERRRRTDLPPEISETITILGILIFVSGLYSLFCFLIFHFCGTCAGGRGAVSPDQGKKGDG